MKTVIRLPDQSLYLSLMINHLKSYDVADSYLSLVLLIQSTSVPHIRRGNRDTCNLTKFPLFLHKNIHCDPSLEPSLRDGSNEGSQCMFSLRNKKSYL